MLSSELQEIWDHKEQKDRKCQTYPMKYFNRYRQCQRVSLCKHTMCHIVYLYQSLNLLRPCSKGSTSPTMGFQINGGFGIHNIIQPPKRKV